jgi:hypothetical protein
MSLVTRTEWFTQVLQNAKEQQQNLPKEMQGRFSSDRPQNHSDNHSEPKPRTA